MSQPAGKGVTALKKRVLVVTAGQPSKRSFLADTFREVHGADVIPGKRLPESCVDRILQPLGLGRVKRNEDTLNRNVVRACQTTAYDLMVVIKGLSVTRDTIWRAKRDNPSCKVVCWTCDDQSLPHNQSRVFLDAAPAYDQIFTCKSNNIRYRELEAIGFRRVDFLFQAYSERHHTPLLKPGSRFTDKVMFIGYAERKRLDYLNYLAENGVIVDVYGNGWNKSYYRRRLHDKLNCYYTSLIGRDYAEAISNSSISLCFLRELNRDLHTSRTLEIPACQGFMLAERTDEHTYLFREGVEAEFFDSKEELLKKVVYYQANPEERKKIAGLGENGGVTLDHRAAV